MTDSTASPAFLINPNIDFATNQKLLEEQYEFREQLGTGAFSEVKKAIHKASGKQVAVKIIHREKCVGKESMIQSEMEILKRIKHENIIQLYDMFECADNIYLIMELVTGGELFDSIVARGHYTERDAANIIQKILMAVDYLHSKGIAHRDLKPENLLFYSQEPGSKIMISDFGLSKIFNDEEVMKTACGTPGYVAPEVLKRQGYGREVDIWSLGVISYILLCGYPPFYDDNSQELFQQIMRGDYEFDSPHWDDISKEAKDFISKTLVVDPKKRYTTTQCLQHLFIIRNCPPPSAPPPIPPPRKQTPNADISVNSEKKQSKKSPVVEATTNLAQRVATNLRNRGMSIGSRRKSADIRATANKAVHAPPPAVPNNLKSNPKAENAVPTNSNFNKIADTIMENNEDREDEVCGKKLTPKRNPEETKVSDSGCVAEGSKDSVATKINKDSVDVELLQKLGQMNRLIEKGLMTEAHQFLMQMDCPERLKGLYENMIFNSESFQQGRNRKIVTEDGPMTKIQKTIKLKSNPSEEYLNELSSLLETSKLNKNAEPTVQLAQIVQPIPAEKNSKSDGANFLHGILKVFDKLNPITQLYYSEQNGSASISPNEPRSSIRAPSEVKILTFNLMIRPPGIKNNTSDYKDARLNYFCEEVLPFYDVVALQEVFAFGSRRRETLFQRASQLGFRSWVGSPAKGFFESDSKSGSGSSIKIDGGLVVLSKFNIVKSSRITFQKGANADRLCAKGAIYAKIQIPLKSGETFIHIFTTNLQSSSEIFQSTTNDLADATIAARFHQLGTLKRFIDTTLRSELSFFNYCSPAASNFYRSTSHHETVLLMGDFNVNGRKFDNVACHSDQYLIMKRVIQGEQTAPSSKVQTAALSHSPLHLRAHDLAYNAIGEHPITFGAVNIDGKAKETILTHKKWQGSCLSLDYIFDIEVADIIHPTMQPRPPYMTTVNLEKTEVQTFFVNPDTVSTSAEELEILESGLASTRKENATTDIEVRELVFSNSHISLGKPPIAYPDKKNDIIGSIESLATTGGNFPSVSGSYGSTEFLSNFSHSPNYVVPSASSQRLNKIEIEKEIQQLKLALSNQNVTKHERQEPGKPKKTAKFSQLSDHYGISCLVQIQGTL